MADEEQLETPEEEIEEVVVEAPANIQPPVVGTLHQVFGVTSTAENNVYLVECEITDIAGERYRCNYVSRPDDNYGLAPTIRAWLEAHEGEW